MKVEVAVLGPLNLAVSVEVNHHERKEKKREEDEDSAASYLFLSTTGIFQQNEIYPTAGSPSECPLIARSRQITPS